VDRVIALGFAKTVCTRARQHATTRHDGHGRAYIPTFPNIPTALPMPISTLSFKRPVTSYAKVQAIVGRLIRNRAFQLRRRHVRSLTYLDVGCGPNTHDNVINLDYLWHPKVDVCWDILKGLPFSDGSMDGIYSEHCIEHFNLKQVLQLLVDFHRVLKPSGGLRLIVPDAELYLRTYVSQSDGDLGMRFPYQDQEEQDPIWAPMRSVNRVYYQDRESPFGHQTMFDFRWLKALLMHCGFAKVARCEFGRGSDPNLLLDTPIRKAESLYLEATKG
jgi:predicted SAM-dependent methyltransferase